MLGDMNIFYNNFKEMLEKNYPTKSLDEDGVAGTTTAAIPVKVVVSKEKQKEYVDTNKVLETTEISKLVSPISPSANGIDMNRRKTFLEFLVDKIDVN